MRCLFGYERFKSQIAHLARAASEIMIKAPTASWLADVRTQPNGKKRPQRRGSAAAETV